MSINDTQEQTHRRTQKIAHVTYFGNSMISLEDFVLAPFFFHEFKKNVGHRACP